jgi:hypothetical protein
LGTRWRSWLKHCTTSWKVVGSIPEGVNGISHQLNPSSRNMALRSTQHVGLTTLPPSCADFLEILWVSTSCSPVRLSKLVMGLLYLYLYPYCYFSNLPSLPPSYIQVFSSAPYFPTQSIYILPFHVRHYTSQPY